MLGFGGEVVRVCQDPTAVLLVAPGVCIAGRPGADIPDVVGSVTRGSDWVACTMFACRVPPTPCCARGDVELDSRMN